MPAIITADVMARHAASFNRNDHELYRQHVPNDQALDWMRENVPLLDCPDAEIETTYYFRWWTFRKHIRKTPDGFIITEFLPPVGWAGKHNAICCPAAHHFREGRWLKGSGLLRDYALYWLRKGGDPRRYSFWIADSLLAYSLASGDRQLAIDLLPELVSNFDAWEKTHSDTTGLYWQEDDRDGMECSISGQLSPDHTGYRATINSYMFGDAAAISRIAEWAGQTVIADTYRAKAADIRGLTETLLWDQEARFFKVLPRTSNPCLSDVRELHGYTPWYFNLPGPDKSDAWLQLMDPQGFQAPYGPTTAEQRHPRFAVLRSGHMCQWNGPSWPFSTAVTLTAMANLLNDYKQDAVTRDDYFRTLKTYTRSHSLKLDDGRVVPWIDENLDPFTGEWLARSFLKKWQDGKADPAKGEERGKDYNHSTYCDLIINGLIGIRPEDKGRIIINPLVPDTWDYFCLDGVTCHGKSLTIMFDRTDSRYHKGPGLRIYADSQEIARSPSLTRLSVDIIHSPDNKREMDVPQSIDI
jgi:hypothetical protein